jgi:hypothetical protein
MAFCWLGEESQPPWPRDWLEADLFPFWRGCCGYSRAWQSVCSAGGLLIALGATLGTILAAMESRRFTGGHAKMLVLGAALAVWMGRLLWFWL